MPRQRLTPAKARAYIARWRAVRAAEVQELQAASPEHKLRQVGALMASAKALGWSPVTFSEAAAARDHWRRLRQVYGVQD